MVIQKENIQKIKKQKITCIKFHSKYNNAKNIRGKGT